MTDGLKIIDVRVDRRSLTSQGQIELSAIEDLGNGVRLESIQLHPASASEHEVELNYRSALYPGYDTAYVQVRLQHKDLSVLTIRSRDPGASHG